MASTGGWAGGGWGCGCSFSATSRCVSYIYIGNCFLRNVARAADRVVTQVRRSSLFTPPGAMSD